MNLWSNLTKFLRNRFFFGGSAETILTFLRGLRLFFGFGETSSKPFSKTLTIINAKIAQ